LDCPAGVEIPKTLGIYNSYLVAKANKHPMPNFLFNWEYNLLDEKQEPKNCIACGQCSGRCPQHIDIPHWMKVIGEAHQAAVAK
jgi:predicted aldo/keto reductase-like oxidoreductase